MANEDIDAMLAELETGIPASPTPTPTPSLAQARAGLLYKALGAAIPFGKEAVLSAAGGIEALRGADYETARAIREQEMKQAMQAAEQQYPIAGIASEIAPAFAQPWGAGGRLLKSLGIGATEGLLYGAAEKEGTLAERLKQAIPSAATGGAISAVLPTAKLLSTGAKKLGKAGQMTAVGLTVRDIKKQPELAEKFVKARDAGLFKGFSKKGEALAENLNDQVNKFENLLDDTLKQADAVSAPVYKPDFKTIEKQLEAKYTGKELVAAKQHLAEQGALIAERFDGTLSSLQSEKRKLYRSAYENIENKSLKKTVDRLIGNEMKTTIEKGVDDLALAGKIDPNLVGSIKEANDVYGSVLSFGDAIDAKKAAEQMDDVTKKILSGIRTTGGLGTAFVTGNLSLPATVLAYEALANPSSRYLIGRGLEAGGAGAEQLLGSQLASRLGAGLSQATAREVARPQQMMTPLVPTNPNEEIDKELAILLGQ